MQKCASPFSSQVTEALYVESLGIMTVFFRSGAIYAYEITPEEWDAYQEAPSKGSFIQDLTVYTRIRGRE